MNKFLLILDYYSRKDVQKMLLEIGKSREVVGVYPTGSFDKRPNIIAYPDDILQLVKNGVFSFHGSLERWSNAMALSPETPRNEIEKMRIGWDLIIDPDSPDFEINKITTKLLIEALEDHGIRRYSIKSTGGKGFHLGIPFEAFPKIVNSKPIETLFPDLPRSILEYLKLYISDGLKEKFLELGTAFFLAKKIGKKPGEIIDKDGLDPLKVISIDSAVMSSRHLFRLPYSLHEKSLFVSLPLSASEIDGFEKEDAEAKKIKVEKRFLLEKPKLAEASGLLVEALDWQNKQKPEERKREFRGDELKTRYFGKNYFPPCILKLLDGKLGDGRKRALFILITFLRNVGWSWDDIEKEISMWNEKNFPPLRTNYINTQIRWHKIQKRKILPPNCNSAMYKDIGAYCGDEFHQEIKNPINYPYKKFRK